MCAAVGTRTSRAPSPPSIPFDVTTTTLPWEDDIGSATDVATITPGGTVSVAVFVGIVEEEEEEESTATTAAAATGAVADTSPTGAITTTARGSSTDEIAAAAVIVSAQQDTEVGEFIDAMGTCMGPRVGFLLSVLSVLTSAMSRFISAATASTSVLCVAGKFAIGVWDAKAPVSGDGKRAAAMAGGGRGGG